MLSQIAAEKNKRVTEAKARLPLSEIKEIIREAEPLRPFEKALSGPGISVIAEVKKASPSKGDFQLAMPVGELAACYRAGGADAISVLTEEDFFKGSPADLTAVRQAVGLPVLRKDFLLDAYQLYESRMLCADAVLLIAGFLTEGRLREYLEICGELGMAALVEAHSAAEITMALRAGARILGINNRDLQTFRTDIQTTVKLTGMVPDNILLVSESGIKTRADVVLLEAAGADAILVGETLVRAEDPASVIQKLKRGSAA